MWYAIISEDVENSVALRTTTRLAHVARLEELVSQGRLLIAGPHPAIDSSDPSSVGFTGSLVVAEFASLDEAKTWADADPYVDAGVYSRVTVKPFNLVLP